MQQELACYVHVHLSHVVTMFMNHEFVCVKKNLARYFLVMASKSHMVNISKNLSGAKS
jgi:hypothetical protein